jgi:hypothetical protein
MSGSEPGWEMNSWTPFGMRKRQSKPPRLPTGSFTGRHGATSSGDFPISFSTEFSAMRSSSLHASTCDDRRVESEDEVDG